MTAADDRPPFCELHVHIEGTLEPATIFELARARSRDHLFASRQRSSFRRKRVRPTLKTMRCACDAGLDRMAIRPLLGQNNLMPENDRTITLRPAHGPVEYPRLVEIWRSAVRATHDFLDDADFARIESNLASAYFPAVDLIVADRDGVAVGFAGVAEGNLEMLFVSDDVRGTGIGTRLLTEAIAHHGVTRVDVNEQNASGRGFYLSRGFAQVGRSDLDADGRPYPILHLALPA